MSGRPAGLAGVRRLGREWREYATVDSTNAEVLRLAAAGAPEGLVVLAERQTHGRGRLGRRWHHLGEAGLAMSVLLRPQISPVHIAQLTLVAGIAVHDALVPLVPSLRLKWPNDLVHQGAKLGGILTEMRAEKRCVRAVVVGIGINLDRPSAGWPEAIGQQATDLASIAGRKVQRRDVAVAIVKALDDAYEEYLQAGFADLRQRWWAAHAATNRWVRVHDGRTYISGIASGLDADGALLLDTGRQTRRILAGEVELAPCP